MLLNFTYLQIDQATLGLDREILLLGAKERIVRAYFRYMIDVAEIYGATRVQAQKELAESIFFEIQLAKVRFLMVFVLKIITLAEYYFLQLVAHYWPRVFQDREN